MYGAGGKVIKIISPTEKVQYICPNGLNRTQKGIINSQVSDPSDTYIIISSIDPDISNRTSSDGLGSQASIINQSE